MARGPVCTFCEAKLTGQETFCSGCGHPTDRAGHEERVLWELGQWEVSRGTSAVASPAQRDAVAARTKILSEEVRVRAANPKPVPKGDEADSPHRRSFASRFRRTSQRDTTPAAAPAARVEVSPSAPRPEPVATAGLASKPEPVAKTRPAAKAGPAAKPAAVVKPGPAAKPAAVVKPAPVRKVATTARPAAAATRVVVPPSSMSATATAPAIVPETIDEAEVASPPRPRVAPAPAERPLVTIRRQAAPKPEPANHSAPPAVSGRAPARPAEPRAVPSAPKEPKRVRAPMPGKAKDREREHQKRARKHRRHSRRVTRRAASLDLKAGERVSLSIEGWSRFRRATLVVTNFRVALVTRVPPQVRWIPLEEVSTVTRRWQGTWSVVVSAPTEILTLQKAKGQILASFKELLDSEVKEARSHGSDRHNAELTQDWVDRASHIWDSRFQRFRLWVRRHPLVNVLALAACSVGAMYLLSFLTAAFSPVR